MKKITVSFYGASVTQQSINQNGVMVGYVPHTKKILEEKYSEYDFVFHQLGFGSNHLDDAGYLYFSKLLDTSPDIVFLEWHTTGLAKFDLAKYNYIIEKLLDINCTVFNLILPFKRCIGKPERENIKQSRWYQDRGVRQVNFYKLLDEKEIDKCLRDEVHTNQHGGSVYGNIISKVIIDIVQGKQIEKDSGEIIIPTESSLEAPKVSSFNLQRDLEEDETMLISYKSTAEQVQFFCESTVGHFSPILDVRYKNKSETIMLIDQWCSYERKCLKPISPAIGDDVSSISFSISRNNPLEREDLQHLANKNPTNLRKMKNIEKIYCQGGEILNVEITKRKTKVFIFANCHGAIYKQALHEADKEKNLDIEHVISYENMNNFENIKPKFAECDILIIQPVQNYEKFKIENIKPLLKQECELIRVPFFRFNGYWDKENIRNLTKFTQPAVMFFPNINTVHEAKEYLEKDLKDQSIYTIFDKGIEELKALENQGDIKFVDFFIKNHQKVPLFRDPYHPTDIVYKYISSQIITQVRKRLPFLLEDLFKISSKWAKEYGHFKPIQNKTAKILGLEYNLDSFFKFSRQNYLESIIEYESSNNEIIDDLGKLNTLLTLDPDDKKQQITITNQYIVYDKDWQYPAITEQYAFQKIANISYLGENNIYIAFPWATLIDKLNKQGKKASSDLLKILEEIKQKIPKNKNVITVCQHILMLKFEELFTELGVTHVFWTHAIKNQTCFPKNLNISIYPFPLYPVQAVELKTKISDKRDILYSFVGAKSNQWYLTQSRTHIIELLGSDNRGLVIGRDTWHFNNVVYDHQIQSNADSNKELVNSKATEEFKEIVQKSIFSLCPSGTGPNSIRLWESIGFGTIPVILADTYLPPGNIELWKEAAIFCEETEEAIKTLPDRLEKIALNTALIERKRSAMKQLWMLYGPDCFIYDVQKLFLTLDRKIEKKVQYMKGTYLEKLVINMIETQGKDSMLVHVFMNGIISRFLSSSEFFTKVYNEDKQLRIAIKFMINSLEVKKLEYFKKILTLRKIDFLKEL